MSTPEHSDPYMNVKIHLPPLHEGQMIIDKDPARFKAIVIGRRFGKSTYGVRKCVKYALKTGYTYWWIGPTYPVASIGWNMLKKLAWQVNEVSPVEIREADMKIIFRNGGTIAIKSAVNPDSLRGEKLGGVVFDEFAQIPEVTWTEVIGPALADLQGWADFIGTPKGKNWAYKLYQGAKVWPNWAAFQLPTGVTEDGTANTPVIKSNNPYVSKDEIERQRLIMSPEAFAQEWLADFGASQYLVYPQVSKETHEWRGPVPEFVSYHGGMDFGGDTIGAHKSATIIAGKTKADELIIIAAFEQSGPNIEERMYNWVWEQELALQDVHRALKTPFPGVTYRADKSQMVGISFMRSSGLKVWKTKGGPDSVTEGIELVHRRLKLRKEVDNKPKLYWLKGVPFVEEALTSYRYPEPKNDGSIEKKNPLKVDDDTVDALRYMVEGVDRGPIGDPQQLYQALIPRIG